MSSLFWVDGPWPGKLAISARPRGGDWLDDELAAWRREGITTVVSLLTPEEEQELGLEREAAQSRHQGIRFLSLPVADRQVPQSESEMQALVQDVDQILSSSGNVLVHCRQGIGRSGLLAACLLMHRGENPQTAMQNLSKLRGTSVPETREQQRWLEEYPSKIRVHATPKI